MIRVLALAVCWSVAVLVGPSAPAQAQATPAPGEPIPAQIALALTADEILVTSRFTGAQLTLYGVVRDSSGADDIIVVLRGPTRTLLAMRKQRVAGVWLNGAPARFTGTPGYYAAASTRPFDLVAPPDVLRREAIGADNVPLRVEGDRTHLAASQISDYRRAILREKVRKGLYRSEIGAVDRLDAGLFRASVSVPASAPTGLYRADAYLVRTGRIIARSQAVMTVDRAGLERSVYEFAHSHPLVYGVAAVLLALIFGAAAAEAFKRR